jgi:hypothetical protein
MPRRIRAGATGHVTMLRPTYARNAGAAPTSPAEVPAAKFWGVLRNRGSLLAARIHGIGGLLDCPVASRGAAYLE